MHTLAQEQNILQVRQIVHTKPAFGVLFYTSYTPFFYKQFILNLIFEPSFLKIAPKNCLAII